MGTHLETRLHIDSWDEKPYRELPDGSKFTRAEVRLTGTGDGFEGEGTWDALMYYAPDGNAAYLGLMQLTGRLDGRDGSFVLQGSGAFDGGQAAGDSSVVAGSGTGDLTGLRGTARSVSTHADYPHMPLTLDYDLAEPSR
ncbi:MAG: DUF3224 domain-containing protein [Micromonosporaceae bacterium]|nr:DUF3224 domain-containing protein [Micromonosporaceae bacterium]